MSSRKKDSYLINKLFLEFINALTEEQFNNLIVGNGEIKYTDKAIDISKKNSYRELLKNTIELSNENRIQYIKEESILNTKAKLIDFCKYINVDYKMKDTNETIISNIALYVEQNKEEILYKINMENDLEDEIRRIAKDIEEFMDIDEAKKYIKESKCLSNKANLLKVAKKLNVFIEKDGNYESIVDKILSSVVESKIRSYTIRKKI